MFDALRRHFDSVSDRRIEALFDADPERGRGFSSLAGELLLDYSKTNIDATARGLLIELLERADVAGKRAAMFSGAPINATEGRAVLHTALRNIGGGPVEVDGADVVPAVRAVLGRMEQFAQDLRAGRYEVSGGKVRDVINIGIGGSDLGPAMASRALAPYADGPRCHFVSNVDPADIAGVMQICDPATTLVIVASKTFTTIETMSNAKTVRAWISEAVETPECHFAAVSSATERTAEWGIPAERTFGFADWVGGRYSLWGPIGLPLMIGIGAEAFRAFLQGGAAMDDHFCNTPWERNLPALLALVGIWHHQICGYPTRAVLPYDNLLGRFPAYLQQLEMESNGKRVTVDGEPVAAVTGPVVWGEPGTNGQHAFYQLIHQGTQVVPCEFLVAATGHEDGLHHQHRLLVANCLAQSEALMRGRRPEVARAQLEDKAEGAELERLMAHRTFPGNRPSVTMAYPQLTPHMLGMLVALYEHRVFVEGAVLGINSFDQWGVELGKELATALQPVIEGRESAAGKDSSTAGLVDFLQARGL